MAPAKVLTRLAALLLLLATPNQAIAQDRGAPGNTAEVSGRVLSAEGEPVAGATVTGRGQLANFTAKTDAQGRFTLNVFTKPRDQRLGMMLLATAPGDLLASQQLGYTPASIAKAGPYELKLQPAKKLTARVLDQDGQPIADARVAAYAAYRVLIEQQTDAQGVATLLLPSDIKLQNIFAEKPGAGFDYRTVSTYQEQNYQPKWFEQGEVELRLGDAGAVTIDVKERSGKPVAGMPLHIWLMRKPGEPDVFNNGGDSQTLASTTNAQGRAVFPAIPKWQQHSLTVWPTSSLGKKQADFVRRRINVPLKHIGGEPLATTVTRPTPVRGRVLNPDGKPVGGITVSGRGAGYGDDPFHDSTITNAQGVFELNAHPDELLMLVAGNQEWAAPAIDGLITKPGEPIEGLEFRLQPATRVFGRATVASKQGAKPIAGAYLNLNQSGRSLNDIKGELPQPAEAGRRNRWIGSTYYRSAQTDDDGRYEFFLGPGQYSLSGLSQVDPIQFTITNETEIEHNLRSARPESGEATLRVVTGQPPRPVAGARITGIYRSNWARRFFQPGRTDENGEYRTERQLHLLALEATSADKQLRGSAELDADADEITITLAPTATATGRLVDHLFGEPMPGEVIQYGTKIYIGEDEDRSSWQTAWGGNVTTDADGRFHADGLIPGREYEFDLTNRHPDGSTRSWIAVATRSPRPGEEIKLGDVSRRTRRNRGTLEELIEHELQTSRESLERLARALDSYNVKDRDWPLVIVFVDEPIESAAAWFRLQHVTAVTRDRLAGCHVLPVGAASDGAFPLASKLGLQLFTSARPIVVCYDPEGKHEVLTGDQFTRDGKLDAQRLADFLDEHLADRYGS